jgi:hypothetical protein
MMRNFRMPGAVCAALVALACHGDVSPIALVAEPNCEIIRITDEESTLAVHLSVSRRACIVVDHARRAQAHRHSSSGRSPESLRTAPSQTQAEALCLSAKAKARDQMRDDEWPYLKLRAIQRCDRGVQEDGSEAIEKVAHSPGLTVLRTM